MNLTFEQTTERFGRLIHFMANKFTPPPSQAYDKEDFYQDGLVVLYDCWNKYKEKSIEEFKTIFSVSLKRLLCNKSKKCNVEKNVVSSNAFISFGHGRSNENEYEDFQGRLDDNLNNVYIQEGLEQLKELLSDNVIALAILNELLSPSERTLWEFKMDKARKRMIHDQGHEEVRLTTSMDIRMHHIARALDISLNDLNKGLKDIREQAYNVFKN